MEQFLEPQTLIFLFVAAIIAGFLDTVAGGGGLITLPALLLAQAPLLNALATNRLQASFGTFTAMVTMERKGLMQRSALRLPFLASLCGSITGTMTVMVIDSDSLQSLIPIILLFVAIYFLLAPRAGDVERKPRIKEPVYLFAIIPSIGFYCGSLGPGAGSFFSLAGVSLRGQTLVTATAWAKVLDFAANLASLAVFAMGGKVLWSIGAVMIAGQVIGAYGGSLAVIRGGARIVRPIIVIMCIAMIARYILE